MSTDWIPPREQDFADLCEVWKKGLSDSANIRVFDWKTPECGAVLTAIETYLTARTDCINDNSSKNLLRKRETRDAAVSIMRDFANSQMRFNKQMRDEDRLSYGLHPTDGSQSQDTEPVSFPEASADTSVIRQVTIHFWDSVSKKRGKPAKVHGAEIRWALLDYPPESINGLIHSDFDTASPFTLRFDEADRGKRIYFCLRWESKTNLKGPYSAIYSAIIG